MIIKRMLLNYIQVSRYSSTSLLKTGDKLKQRRIFTSQDLAEYSNVSFDANPLHLDPEFARNAGFKDKLVPGMLVASLFPRIIASNFPGAVYASQTLRFRLPVYVDEEIFGEVEATSIRQLKKKYILVPILQQGASTILEFLFLTERLWLSYQHYLQLKRKLGSILKPK